MKVLVCGGRDYLDWPHIFAVLDQFIFDGAIITHIIEGGARGADTGAAMWAFCRGIPYTTYWANWTLHKKAAGPIRNQRMFDLGKPDLVVAFPGGPGTKDMSDRAFNQGFKVMVIRT